MLCLAVEEIEVAEACSPVDVAAVGLIEDELEGDGVVRPGGFAAGSDIGQAMQGVRDLALLQTMPFSETPHASSE